MFRIAALTCIALIVLHTPDPSVAEEVVAETLCELELPQQPIRVSPLLAQLQPNRILIVRDYDRQDRLKEQQVLADRLATHLRRDSLFDVVECKRCVCDRSSPLRTGRFDERQLLEYANTFGVDSVLYCTVQSIDAYRPMKIEIQFLLININQSVAVASGSLTFDLSDPITEQIYLNQNPIAASHMTSPLSSPSRLIDFAASQFAEQFKSLW